MLSHLLPIVSLPLRSVELQQPLLAVQGHLELLAAVNAIHLAQMTVPGRFFLLHEGGIHLMNIIRKVSVSHGGLVCNDKA